MLKRPIIKTNLQPLESYWIGDEAVDKAATDIDQYIQNGTGVILKTGQKASKILIKELTQEDVLLIYDLLNMNKKDIISNTFDATLIYYIARLVLKSIEGVSLDHVRIGGKQFITEEDTEALTLFAEQIPTGHICENCKGSEGTETEGKLLCNECGNEMKAITQLLNLIGWVGGLAFNRFLRRRGN